jgi:peptide/nickel transport system permease protein
MQTRPLSVTARFLGWSRRNVFVAACAAGFGLIVLLALLAPWLGLADPAQIDFSKKLLPPGTSHWFGTDGLGRDIFSGVLFGARVSLLVALGVVAIATVIGIPMGLIAGYAGGWIDSLFMRLSDVFLAFPPLLLPITLSALLGPGLLNAMFAVAISWFPWYARIVRSTVLTVKSDLYVLSARAIGTDPASIALRHVLPNSLSPVIVQASLDFGFAILTTASLSFIGMGAVPPTVEWGLMVASSRSVFLEYWWTAMFPGMAIFLTVFFANVMVDGIRDSLDPKLVRQP